ncbi:5-oxoprolinase subunit PxpB [Tenacibaculum amylolyticum]|uniref:5-oxoprolinase subunit PxpB n=1 Tax=Tenacibaculum amylolyticum TaxID=104269 RepID=UPI003893E766
MKNELIFKPYGVKAILIEWSPIIDKSIIKDITNFKNTILKKEEEVIQDFIIGYNSLLVNYVEEVTDFASKIKRLKELYKQENTFSTETNYRWEIPVCYDLDYGIDLEAVAQIKGLTPEVIIQSHTEAIYTVYFIGFLPGFLYLGGLQSQLHIDRKAIPNLKVPKGAVALGGVQTGIYPQESAGGWHIIGNTPISFFDVTQENPCFVKSGDEVCFKSINKETYLTIEAAIAKGSYQLIKTEIDD